jgi:hypothetical protein
MTTGYVVDHYSYTPILLTAAGLPVIGTVVLFVIGDRQVRQDDRDEGLGMSRRI